MTAKLNKEPRKYQKCVKGLEDACFDTLTALNECTDEQYKAVGMPLGFMNKLKAHIREEMIKFGANPDDNKEVDFVDKQCWIFW